jgi:hypothetical protein
VEEDEENEDKGEPLGISAALDINHITEGIDAATGGGSPLGAVLVSVLGLAAVSMWGSRVRAGGRGGGAMLVALFLLSFQVLALVDAVPQSFDFVPSLKKLSLELFSVFDCCADDRGGCDEECVCGFSEAIDPRLGTLGRLWQHWWPEGFRSEDSNCEKYHWRGPVAWL